VSEICSLLSAQCCSQIGEPQLTDLGTVEG